MLDMHNEYFRNMKLLLCDWQKKKDDIFQKKKEIIYKFGYDSKEYEAWYDENKASIFPFSSGASKAYHAYNKSVEMKQKYLTIDTALIAEEVKDFIDTLRTAGIESFVYTSSSSSAMENMHDLAANGCTMVDLFTVESYSNKTGQQCQKLSKAFVLSSTNIET